MTEIKTGRLCGSGKDESCDSIISQEFINIKKKPEGMKIEDD
jgi:hypothetical protein